MSAAVTPSKITIADLEGLVDAGLNVIPVNMNGSKWDKTPQIPLLPIENENNPKPSVYQKGQKRSWNWFRENKVTELWLDYWAGRAEGVAVVCGPISGNVMVIDYDLKNHPTPNEIWRLVKDQIFEITGIEYYPVIQQTKSGYYHMILRVDGEHPKGGKLASRYLEPGEEGYKEGQNKKIAFIETRRSGQYFVIAPTPGYKIIEGSLEDIPVLDTDKVDQILSFIRSLDETYKDKKIVKHKASEANYSSGYKVEPRDAYNQTDHWKDIMVNNGWTQTDRTDGKSNQYWQRPGTENAWSASWNSELRIFYVFTSNSPFEQDKGYTPQAIRAILDFDGDFSKCTKQLLNEGYGERWTAEDEETKREIVVDLKMHGLIDAFRESGVDLKSIPKATKKRIESLPESQQVKMITAAIHRNNHFHKISDKGSVSIIRPKFRNLLKNEFNIGLIENSNDAKGKPDYVRITGPIIEIISLVKIKLLALSWIRENVKEAELVENKMMSIPDSGWKLIIEAIGFVVINLLRDTISESYHFFENGFVTISKDGPIALRPYDEFPADRHIWKASIINRKFKVIPEHNNSVINELIKKVSGSEEKDPENENEIAKNQLYQSFISSIGYLCTDHKDPSNAFAIVMSEDTENDGEGGGTGKSLIAQAIRHVVRVVTMDGKTWKPENDFAFQKIQSDTKVVFVDDLTKYFKIAGIYNAINGFLNIEKKGKGAFDIPFSESPKFLLATNYDIVDDKIHVRRRLKRLYFTKYFNEAKTPQTEFGKRLFDDWDDDEWNQFYNSMFMYIQFFLRNGFVQGNETKNIQTKKLKLKIGQHGEEFIEFIHRVIHEGNGYVGTKSCWIRFKDEVGDSRIKYARFKEWIEFYCKQNNIGVEISVHRREEKKQSWTVFTIEDGVELPF